MADSRLEIIAHRGLHTEVRENTLDAFKRALAAGAHAIELDVHASADGILLVHHDAVVARDGLQALPIVSAQSDELQRAAEETGLLIPTLEAVLEQFAGRAKVYIEVKALEIELLVARAVRKSPCEVAIHAFDHRVVGKVRDLVPGIQTGILTVSRPVHAASLLKEAVANDYWPHVDFVDHDLVTEIHHAGGKVIAWTANTRDRWESLLAMNVDGICTDHPDRLAEWLS